ncbi:MAG: hypothetical protein ACLRZH_05280 [Ruthenibacterium lactatiformans]
MTGRSSYDGTGEKIKRYVNAIERAAPAPKAKARINGDIGTDIHARLEKGQSIDAIIAEMGTPQEVAAGFNEEMQDRLFPKGSPGAGCSSLRRYWRAEQHCFPFFPFCFFIFKAPAWALSAVQTGRRPFL